MSTTGVLVSGRRRRRRLTAASLGRFARVAWDPQSYRNLLYLALALPLGVAYVAVLVAGLSAGAGLAVIVVGLVLLLATLFALRGMAAVERTLARRLLRISIHPPLEGGIDEDWRQRVQTWLRDPVTWKSLVFLLGKLPMGLLAYAAIGVLGSLSLLLTFAPVLVAITPVIFFGWEIDNPIAAIAAVPVGVLLLLCCLHLFNGMAWIYGICARVMLGPSSVELRERVEGLKDASARILAAADDERRRIERDLHDGAQQRLVALNVLLGVVETKIEKDPTAALPLVARARQEATEAVKELRELARGIHPALLADRGLIAALEALAARAPFKVEITGVPDHRLPPAVEATAYFITAEALTNVAKYAGDEARAWVELAEDRSRLRVTVRDDGIGGADPRRGSGLRGLNDRVAALDGRFEVTSPPGEGTVVVAELPLERP
jgi:signal transduction histidine kinase